MSTAREIPASEEAEQHIIACCLIDGDNGVNVARVVGAGITPESFHWPANRIIFEAILALWSENQASFETLAAELHKRKVFDQVGGMPYLIQVTSKVPTSAHIAYFLAQLQEKKLLRDTIHACTAVIEKAYEHAGDINEFASSANDAVSRALAIAGEQERPVGEVFRDLLDHIDDPETEHPRAVPWGFVDLDRTCGLLQPGTLNVLGGRPSMGKSILADHVSARASEKGREVVLFTYEMPKRDKCIRFAQAKARVNWDRRRQYPGGQEALAEALRSFAGLKNLHVFESDYTGSKVAARCKSIATRRGHLDLIVVDFLQRFADMEPSIGKERTDEKLGRLTGLLKRLAKQYDCPVLLLSSLNRGNVNDERRPRMEDLRASGEIESDADVVVLLHASETTPSGGQQRPKEDEIIAVEFNQEKGRNKGTHYCHLTLTKQITRFDNYNP